MRVAVSLVSISALALAAAPDATTRAAARKIATEGVIALEQGNAELASQRLEKAFELLQAPSIALWSARAFVKQGKLVEGAERYLLAGRLAVSEGNEQAVQEQAKKDAARELSELTPRIPKLVVTVEGAPPSEVSVTLDGKVMAGALIGEEQQLNPGSHSVVATRGAERLEETATLAESQTRTLALRFKDGSSLASSSSIGKSDPSATAASPRGTAQASDSTAERGNTRKTLGYVALAGGGAGLIVGAVGGFVALGKRSELDDSPDCRKDQCLPTAQDKVDSFRTMRMVSSVGFIAGGVLAGAGVALLLSGGSSKAESARPAPRLALRVQTNGITLDGSF